MTAEPIAEVVRDIRRGNVRHPINDRAVNRAALERAQRPQSVVDATAIYRSLVAKDRPVDLYGDHPCIAPPWNAASICYQNGQGNAVVMQTTAQPWPSDLRWETPNVVDWDNLRWLLDVFVWVGGRGGAGSAPTTGPCHLIQFAVTTDGEPADIHYAHLVPDYPLEAWDMAQLVVLQSLNFLNCRNVELVEPERRRPERRRLARTGVTVQTITVRPVTRRTRSASTGTSGGAADGAVPIVSVRGHFAHYGEAYGRGKLFGKLEGRFWIPARAHAAVEADAPRDYVLKP